MVEVRTQRVLIVDDDPLDREVYKRYLLETPRRRFVFAEEPTGRRALKSIPEFQPDCILLDFTLPDMSGLDLLREMRNGNGILPAAVVMLTAARDERVAVDAMKSGVMDYLPKGQVATETIAHTIDNAIERFRMQRELELQQQRYRSLVEAIPHIVWVADSDGKIEFANSRWAESLGLSIPEFNREGWPALVHSEDRARTIETWNNGLGTGSAFQIEHRLHGRATEVYRWYLTRAVPIRDLSGAAEKWFGTCTDIEDQKRAQNAVFNKQRLESLGLLAGGIAHDFNNLLTGILSGASFIADSMPDADPQQLILRDVIKAGEQAAHLTRQMLAYAGKGRILIDRVDMNDLVRTTLDLIKAAIPKNVSIVLETQRTLPLVEADAGQMRQVIMNLATNAAESIDESQRGTVSVTTESVSVTEPSHYANIVAGSLSKGTYVVVEVKDTGSGMDEATRQRIFTPFFTTKFTGRGLGLSAVEGILRAQYGALELRTAPGSGSTFRIYLPAIQRRADPGHDEDYLPTGNGGRILMVDDEDVVRRMGKLSLENAGFQVDTAESGPAALQLLESAGKNAFSLILLDLSMPGMDGKDVMREVRARGFAIPVMICSGFSELEIDSQFLGLDVADFIQKPFTARQLANRVSRLLTPQR